MDLSKIFDELSDKIESANQDAKALGQVSINDFEDDSDDDDTNIYANEVGNFPLMRSSDMVYGRMEHDLFKEKKTAEEKYKEYLYYEYKKIIGKLI